MTVLHTIQTALEAAAIVVVLCGIRNERKIALWERKLFRRIKRGFKIVKR